MTGGRSSLFQDVVSGFLQGGIWKYQLHSTTLSPTCLTSQGQKWHYLHHCSVFGSAHYLLANGQSTYTIKFMLKILSNINATQTLGCNEQEGTHDNKIELWSLASPQSISWICPLDMKLKYHGHQSIVNKLILYFKWLFESSLVSGKHVRVKLWDHFRITSTEERICLIVYSQV